MKCGIEIPFGAQDSELKGWTYTIPEGYIAEIKDGKVIVKPEDSEDERTRKELVEFVTSIKEISESGRTTWAVRESDAKMCERFLIYLENQKLKEWNDEDKEMKLKILKYLSTRCSVIQFEEVEEWLNNKQKVLAHGSN